MDRQGRWSESLEQAAPNQLFDQAGTHQFPMKTEVETVCVSACEGSDTDGGLCSYRNRYAGYGKADGGSQVADLAQSYGEDNLGNLWLAALQRSSVENQAAHLSTPGD